MGERKPYLKIVTDDPEEVIQASDKQMPDQGPDWHLWLCFFMAAALMAAVYGLAEVLF